LIDHLFRLPEQFWSPALYERFGAIIKDRATGRIVGHLQEVGSWKLSSSLPIPGGNPLHLVTEAVQVGQLAGIQQTLNVVQTLATVGAIASVASLGVSVVGFSVVTAKLSRMDRKLDRMLGEMKHLRDAVERLNLKMDAFPLAMLKARLEEVGIALHYEPLRRRDALQRAISGLSDLRHYYHALLANPSLYSIGTSGLAAILDAHERLVACCQGELMAELSLADDPALVQRRWSLQHDQLLSVQWQTGRELYDLVEEGDRRTGVYSVTSPAERREKVKALVDIRSESLARLSAAPHLAAILASTGTSPSEYMAAISAWAGERPVVVLANPLT
jgi:hypothetical protein